VPRIEDTLPQPAESVPGDVDPVTLTIHHYIIESELAHGGLGRVLVARDRRLGRKVALKVPLHPNEAPRFAHEVRITSRLQHPSIVPLYEAGRLPSGQPFFAMKLMAGRTLSEAISGARTPAERLALLPSIIAVADAVAYAHDQKIVHRDVKPSNVVLGDFGEAVLLDWGVARELSASSPDDGIAGTPSYMAPEQAAGAPLDPRFDVYALGAMLHHVLAGEAPYHGSSVDVLERLAKAPPPALEERWPGVPPELATIVGKAMARDPAQRYPSARELAADLRRFATGQLVGAHAYSIWALARRWLRRHRVAVTVALLSGAFLTTEAIVSVRRIAAARNDAERRRDALILAQARTSLSHDPTLALAWLKQYPAGGADWRTARSLAADALDSGVALHSFPRTGYAFPMKDGSFVLHGTPLLRQWRDGKTRLIDSPDPALSSLILAPDRTRFGTFSRDGTFRIWPADGGPPQTLWSAGQDGVIAGDARWSPDGKWVAVMAGESEVWLFSVAGGPPRRLDPKGFVHKVAFSPDDRFLAGGTANGVAWLWPLDGGEARALTGHTADVRALDFSADGRTLATASHDGTVRLWDLGTGQSRVLRVENAGRRVLVVRFLADGRVLSGGDDGVVRLWDASGTARVIGSHSPGGVTALDTAGSLVVSGGEDRMVHAWDLDSGAFWSFRGHEGAVLSVTILDEGRRVISCGFDNLARVWELRPTAQRVLHDSEAPVSAVSWGPDGKWLATSSWDHQLRLCDPGCRVIGSHDAPILALARSPDGLHLATAGGDGELRLWDVRGGAPRILRGHHGPVKRLAFSSDGSRLVSAGNETAVWLWDTASGAGQQILTHADAVMWVSFAPDGKRLASAGLDGTVRLWQDGRATVLRGHTDWVLGAAFAPDGKTLASAGHDGTVRLWDLATETGRIVGRHDSGATSVAFSPDGKWLASAGIDRTARLWRLDGGDPRILRGHEASLHHLAFSPDGKRLAVTADDGTLRVWTVDGGEGRALRGHGGMIISFAWSPDGRRLASAGADHTARLWQLDALLPIPADPPRVQALFSASSSVQLDGDELATP
jgi:WD40 repeat protein